MGLRRNADATRCEVSIEPAFNRTAIFEIKDPNFHGVPRTIRCPENRARLSFQTYYHTFDSAESANTLPHTTIFAPRTHGTNRITPKALARELTPPVVLK
jgi:hypothetical protein